MRYDLLALVVLAGAGIPIQVALNERLRQAVQSPPLGIALAFGVGAVAMAALALSGVLGRGHLGGAASAPWWAWGGGLFSVAVVLASVLALPEVGAASVIAGTVLGQLVAALAIDHFGWLGVPRSPVDAWKVIGAALLFAGALLMHRR
jgi:transporter family-2 protein